MELLLIFVAGCLSCVMLASWQASLLVGLVLLVRVLLGELLPVRARYLLWGVVLVRLLVPVFPASDFSVFNLAAGITETAGSGDSEFLTTSTANELSVDPSLDGGRTQTSLAQISVTAIQPNESAPAERQSRVRDSSRVDAQPQSVGAAAGSATFRWLPGSSGWLALVWLGGVSWLALRMLLGYRQLSRIVASGSVISDARMLRLFEECRRTVGVKRPVQLVSIGGDMTPAVTGLWRPKILIPERVLSSFSDHELRFVLLHELVHVRRHDLAVNWLAWLVQTLHWFNPVIWFAVRRLRFDRELACDAIVLAHAGETEAASYGHTAIKLLGLFHTARPLPAAVGILDRKRSVVRRIAMIGRYRKPSRLQNSVALLVVLLLAGVGLTDAAPEDQKSERKSEKPPVAATAEAAPSKKPGLVPGADENTSDPENPAERIRFTDITAESGLQAIVEPKDAGESTQPSNPLGSGCAFIDFDGDGDLDVVLVNVNARPKGDGTKPEKDKSDRNSVRLLENNGRGNFKDVTPDDPCWFGLKATGIAVGDFDNDGRPDLYVATIGLNRLLRNLGEGRFEDITLQAGVAGGVDVWSTGCGWVDFDKDGDLDLFVAAHPGNRQKAGTSHGPTLFLNQGNGRFADATANLGLAVSATGASLGVTFADVDQDGWLDIFVANDGMPNWLFQNQNGRKFQDMALRSGVALSQDGRVTSSTGVDFGMLEDGRTGLFVGNGPLEGPNVYVGVDGLMTDRSKSMGLARALSGAATFGTGWLDADLDGVQDIFVLNGFQDGVEAPAALGAQVFVRSHDDREAVRVQLDISVDAKSDPLTPPFNGRGAAFGDIDGDGDVDVLISTLDTPHLLRNENPSKNSWLRFKLIGNRTNRDAIGSRVTIEVASGVLQTRQVMPTRGYLSQSELAVTFGLGQAKAVRRVTIDWVDGSQSEISNVAANQTLVVEQREVFRPLVGVVTDIEVESESVRKGDVLGTIEAAAEGAGKAEPAKDRPSSVVRVDLLDRPEGTLRSIRFDGKDLGTGEKAFGKLAEAIRKWAATPGRPPLAEREVEIRVNSGLKHEYVVRTISVCSGRTNPDSGKSERYVSRIRFATGRPMESLMMSVGFVRSRSGKRLSKKPVVLWDDQVVPLEQVSLKIGEWLKAQNVSPKTVTVTLEADSDVATNSMEKLIHTLQKLGFERFSLRAVDPPDNETSSKEESSTELRLDHVPAPDPKKLEAMIRDIFSNNRGTVVFSDPQTGELVISAENKQTLDRVERLLKELGEEKETDSPEDN